MTIAPKILSASFSPTRTTLRLAPGALDASGTLVFGSIQDLESFANGLLDLAQEARGEPREA